MENNDGNNMKQLKNDMTESKATSARSFKNKKLLLRIKIQEFMKIWK